MTDGPTREHRKAPPRVRGAVSLGADRRRDRHFRAGFRVEPSGSGRRRSRCCSALIPRRRSRPSPTGSGQSSSTTCRRYVPPSRMRHAMGPITSNFGSDMPTARVHWLAGKGEVARDEPGRPAARRLLRHQRPKGARGPAARAERDAGSSGRRTRRGGAHAGGAESDRRRSRRGTRSGAPCPNGDRCRRRTDGRPVRRVLLQRAEREGRSLYALYAVRRAA